LRRYDGTTQFLENHLEARITKKIGRPIRLNPPSRKESFYDGKVIRIGESIGCVFPLTGEGIAPSLLCCDILLDNFNGTKIDVGKYRNDVLHTFEHYEYAFRVLKSAMKDDSSEFVKRGGDLKALISNDILSKSKINILFAT
jgi:flavin-dependent dehydrogenase